EREVRAVLLEGGGEVHATFLDAGVVDRVTLFVAPMLLGGRAAPTVVGGAGRELKAAIRLGPLQARHAGEDLAREAAVLRPGGAVSLERPLRFGGALGGHLVLGHVDGTGTVQAVTRVESTARVRIALDDPALAALLIPQGSVAVDGVSLTVAALDGAAFEVMLIPHTMGATMLGDRLDELKLGMMVAENTAPMGTAFTISVDARRGITTGISAYDRALTIRTLVDSQKTSADLVAPGHMFPLRAMQGGVLRRAGHTEAAVDLARMAGCYPAGVICEVLDEAGSMARLPQLPELARRHGLKLI